MPLNLANATADLSHEVKSGLLFASINVVMDYLPPGYSMQNDVLVPSEPLDYYVDYVLVVLGDLRD